MTFLEARDYIRKRRNPPHDDAGSDLDFVQLWERRCGYLTGIGLGLTVCLAQIEDFKLAAFLAVGALCSFLQYRRFRAIHALFDEHAAELERGSSPSHQIHKTVE